MDDLSDTSSGFGGLVQLGVIGLTSLILAVWFMGQAGQHKCPPGETWIATPSGQTGACVVDESR